MAHFAGLIPVSVLLVALACVLIGDLLYRRIPNWLVLSLLYLWLVNIGSLLALRGFAGLPEGTLTGLIIAVVVLLVGYALFIMRWVGAGDVKLLAVLSLWFAGAAPAFLIVTSLAGGMLVLAMPIVRAIEHTLAHIVQGINLACPKFRIPPPVVFGANPVSGLPYGLAITVGALYVLFI